jgi:hypothetical protein
MVFFKKLIESNSASSSARFINIGGFLVSSVLIAFDTIYSMKLSYEILGVYLLYCAGTYGVNKFQNNKGEAHGT